MATSFSRLCAMLMIRSPQRNSASARRVFLIFGGQLVADLLATWERILACQDVAKHSAASWQQVVVMEFGKRHDITDTTDFCPRQRVIRTCCVETGIGDFGNYGFGKKNLLRGNCQLVADLLRGNWCNGFWFLLISVRSVVA